MKELSEKQREFYEEVSAGIYERGENGTINAEFLEQAFDDNLTINEAVDSWFI